MKNKKLLVILLVSTVAFVLTGCVPGDGKITSEDPAGFFWGVWHGWMAPISLIIGLFDHNIRVYEVINSGWLYDFGFYGAVISGFGGLRFTRKVSKNKKEDKE